MDLTNEALRDILVAILKVDPKYVVPKQGTWWNPQANLPVSKRPATWCAYTIETDDPFTRPMYDRNDESSDPENVSVQERIAIVALQFVGPDAQRVALSVGQWSRRLDVQAAMETVGGRIFSASGQVTPSDFHQDGENTVIAYNVRIRVIWTHEIVTDQELLTKVKLGGEVHYS